MTSGVVTHGAETRELGSLWVDFRNEIVEGNELFTLDGQTRWPD